MSDDSKNDRSGGGFDDWLDDEPGPVTDPYKPSTFEEAEDETEAIIPSGDESETGSLDIDPALYDDPESGHPEDETAEIVPVSVAATDETPDDQTNNDQTAEIEPVSGAEEAVTPIDPPGDDVDDTGELDIVSASDDPDPTGIEGTPETSMELTTGSSDTDELEPIGTTGFGALWSADDGSELGEPSSSGTSPEVFDITRDDYLHTATKEHDDLAESIALADDEETELVALAAPIPGLDATVVGFEDVVEAEGLGRVRARASGDLVARVITGIVLIAALGASLLWRPALVVFALAVFVLGAGEFYTALVRSGRKPIALFGFIGIIGASIGAFFGGALWIPLAFLVAVTLLLLFYAVVPGKVDPMANLALTITVMVWAGLGSFAMLIAGSDSYRTLVFGVVAVVAAMDIAQYFFGRALGRHQLAKWVSPKKTVEGLVAGIIVALTAGALLHFLDPFELTSGLAIGAAVALFAPMGDLAMSAAKRSVGLKDMGSVLPGHGGFMDRIDGLLFVVPVAWAIFVWAGIL